MLTRSPLICEHIKFPRVFSADGSSDVHTVQDFCAKSVRRKERKISDLTKDVVVSVPSSRIVPPVAQWVSKLDSVVDQYFARYPE